MIRSEGATAPTHEPATDRTPQRREKTPSYDSEGFRGSPRSRTGPQAAALTLYKEKKKRSGSQIGNCPYNRNQRLIGTKRSGRGKRREGDLHRIQGEPAKDPPGSNVISINFGDHRERVLERRNELVETHLTLVPPIARRIAITLPPRFELDDLIAWGNLALVTAATRYRPAAHGGTPFSAFARPRVHGGIVDRVRRRHYTESTRPSIEDYPELMVCSRAERDIDRLKLRRRVASAIDWLPADQQQILHAYYSPTEPTFATVAAALGISTARAQELHARAIAEIRARLQGGPIARAA